MNNLPPWVTLGADLVQSRFVRGSLKVWQALYFGHISGKNNYLSRFQGGPRRLQKYGRRYTLVRFGFFGEMPRTSKSVAGAILEGHFQT